VASAQAADLPYKKAAPVEYVKICDAHGAGFFYIPGTDTCLKVGGDVEFYYSFVGNKKTFAGYSVVGGVGHVGTANSSKLTNSTGVKARGRVQLDARNTTAWGTLRTFVSVQVDHTTGDQVPDIVGQVAWSQGWGQAQLSAAAHEESSFLTAVAGAGTSLASKSTWGYAVQGGVEINLPMLAAGDQLWLEGAYTDGALAYNQINSTRGTSYIQTFNGGVIQTDYDAVWTSCGVGCVSVKSPTSWSVLGAFQHYFTPTIIGRLTGSYVQVDYSHAVALAALTSSWNRIKVGPELVWMPVAGFQVGVETLYIRQEDKFPVVIAGAKKDTDGYEATIHIERDF
jgi:hypothetical protein